MSEIAPTIAGERQQLLASLFPDQVPLLWCPLLTHYDAEGAIDRQRMAAHLQHLSPWVKGYLVPGSTGDGWELSGPEIFQLLDFVLGQAVRLNLRLLVGVLKTDAQSAQRSLRELLEWLKARAVSCAMGTNAAVGLLDELIQTRVCGFAVCPPRGQTLSQEEMDRALASFLEAGAPTALYQLPQITQNEMSPALAASLAYRFANFVLFKDSSGADRVALAGHLPEGVFLTRGAEGDYGRWLRAAGGPYHGLLLSTANCFARPLHEMIQRSAANQRAEAETISVQLSGLVNEVFRLVASLPDGNPFTNANKALDHFFAHGPKAAGVPPPRLHAGSRLPSAVIRAAGEALTRHGLMPAKGYLE